MSSSWFFSQRFLADSKDLTWTLAFSFWAVPVSSTCSFCLFFFAFISGPLKREDKSSAVGEASDAFLVMEIFVSDEPTRCPVCPSVLPKPIPHAGRSHAALLGKAKGAGPSTAPSLTGCCPEPNLGLCAPQSLALSSHSVALPNVDCPRGRSRSWSALRRSRLPLHPQCLTPGPPIP